MANDEIHDHDRGLSHDLPRLVTRRFALGALGMAGIGALLGCSTDDTPSTSGSGNQPPGMPGAASSATTTEGEIPEETGGPYPGDGSNGPNVLTESGVVRRDITRSFGSASGVAEGVPLQIDLRVLDLSGDTSTPLAGAAIYLWHCDRDGEYSLYSSSVADENYLRGVQETDAEGRLTFTSIFPAAYAGRWPHLHFEVYPSLAAATTASDRMRTSQIALPEDICTTVYAEPGYEQSVRNLSGTSLDSDNVFSDGWSLQMATVTGDVATGYTARLDVPV